MKQAHTQQIIRKISRSAASQVANFRLAAWVLVLVVGITLWMPDLYMPNTVSLRVSDGAAYAVNYDRKNLRQQDFAGQDLTDNDYTRADLTEANLSNTNLVGVRLFTSHLDRANLEGANLTGATLDGATLVRANLKNAVLEGAYVISADFRGANIEGADFTDVLFDPRVNDLLCETAKGVNPTTGRETRETLYCP